MFFNSQMCYHGLKELPNIFCATVSENVYCYPFGKPRKSCCLKRRQRFTLHWQYLKYTPQELLLGVSYWGSADLQLSRSWDPNEVTRKYPAIIHTPQLPSSAISTWWNPTFQPWIACKLLLAAQHFSRGGGGGGWGVVEVAPNIPGICTKVESAPFPIFFGTSLTYFYLGSRLSRNLTLAKRHCQQPGS